MFNFDYIIKEESKNIINSWTSIQIINTWRFWSGKTIVLLNLINHKSDVDKIYLFEKDLYEAKNKLLINKRESAGLKYLNSKSFIEYANDMDDIYENIEEYIPNKKQEILIVFDDMIADMLSDKNLIQ